MKQSKKVVGLSSRLSHNPALTDLSRSTVTPSVCQGRAPGPCSGATCYALLDRPEPEEGVDEKMAKESRTWGTQVSSGTTVLYSWPCVYIL